MSLGLRAVDLDFADEALNDSATAQEIAESMIRREETLRRLRRMRSRELETYWVGVANGEIDPPKRRD